MSLPAHFFTEVYLAATSRLNKSGAILFIDGAAYYSVLRQLLFSDSSKTDIEFLEGLFSALGFSDEQQVKLLAGLDDQEFWSEQARRALAAARCPCFKHAAAL